MVASLACVDAVDPQPPDYSTGRDESLLLRLDQIAYILIALISNRDLFLRKRLSNTRPTGK